MPAAVTEPERAEPTYSMRVTTRLTGLSADTIRKWEQRYAAVEPQRTDGNTRKFSTRDIHRLSLLRELTQRGHHIMDVAPLGDEKLEALLAELDSDELSGGELSGDDERGFGRLRADYLEAIARFDVRRAADLLSRAATLLRADDLALQVVRPILLEVGQRWHQGQMRIAHEHLVSAQVRGLLTLLLNWSTPQPGARKVLVATPAGHLHEFGALIGAVLAASRGLEPVYLGPNLPEDELLHAVDAARADLLLLSVVRDVAGAELDTMGKSLRRLAARVEVWFGAPTDHPLARVDSGARIFDSYAQLDMALTQLAASASR